MKTRVMRKAFYVSLLIVALFLGVSLMANPAQPTHPSSSIHLQAPPFLNMAYAAASSQTDNGASFLEDEAGISAYTQTAGPIDLSVARQVFRTIEYETEEYIIGSVEVPDYPESHDAHVYVHADGWVVGYYLAEDATGKIMDFRHYDGIEITSTKLENAMNEVLTAVGAVPFEASYYDFRYPNATDLMLIAEVCYSGSDSFELQLPDEYVFYERAWSAAVHGDGGGADSSNISIDGNLVGQAVSAGWGFAHGTLTPVQLPPTVSHTILVALGGGGDAFGGITLTYQEVP
ncbi:MAG: hypothetical protein JXA93_03795 [Anaerolineae bacterium]|nr:hypothetical protein [Anaerolineae bacterium]